MEEFRTEVLSGFSHLVINGYFPSLTVKHVSDYHGTASLKLKHLSKTFNFNNFETSMKLKYLN